MTSMKGKNLIIAAATSWAEFRVNLEWIRRCDVKYWALFLANLAANHSSIIGFVVDKANGKISLVWQGHLDSKIVAFANFLHDLQEVMPNDAKTLLEPLRNCLNMIPEDLRQISNKFEESNFPFLHNAIKNGDYDVYHAGWFWIFRNFLHWFAVTDKNGKPPQRRLTWPSPEEFKGFADLANPKNLSVFEKYAQMNPHTKQFFELFMVEQFSDISLIESLES